jgi:hypothetical protein
MKTRRRVENDKLTSELLASVNTEETNQIVTELFVLHKIHAEEIRDQKRRGWMKFRSVYGKGKAKTNIALLPFSAGRHALQGLGVYFET